MKSSLSTKLRFPCAMMMKISPQAVAEVRGGAFPSYALGYYPRNNAFYKQWDAVARERGTFTAWIDRHIRGTQDFAGFRRSLEDAGAAQNA